MKLKMWVDVRVGTEYIANGVTHHDTWNTNLHGDSEEVLAQLNDLIATVENNMVVLENDEKISLMPEPVPVQVQEVNLDPDDVSCEESVEEEPEE